MAKKKKQPKIEKVFEGSSVEEQVSAAENEEKKEISAVDEFLGVDPNDPGDGLTDYQREKKEKLDSVKSKISQILKSQNIEIVDENFGDEYESGSGEATAEKAQADYDSLSALFGDANKNKKKELTLTIDDFDYTYIGQYIDEYDLMHLKNIKRIKLQRKYPKWMKKAIIAASIVAVLGLGGFLGFYLTREVPVYLKNVTLSQVEHDYYVDEVFDYTGLYLIAEYSDGSSKHVKLDKSHLKGVLGRVEHVGKDGEDIQFLSGNAAVLTFNYQGFDVTYTVNLLKKVESGLQAIYTTGLFNVKADECISSSVLKVLIDYGNFGLAEVNLASAALEVYVDGDKLQYVSGQGYKVVSDMNTSSAIKIVYKYNSGASKIELNITYQEGVYISSVTI